MLIPSAPSLTLAELTTIAEAGKYNLIPIFVNLPADLETPVSAFLKVQQGSNSFLLESVQGGENLARYSFIGTEPYKTLEQNHVDPLRAVEQELSLYSLMPVKDLPSFSGGGVGYISYDCIKHFEPKVEIPDKNTLHIPESIFMFCRSLVVFDHVMHSVKLVTHVHLPEADAGKWDLEHLYRGALQRLAVLTERMDQHVPAQVSPKYDFPAEGDLPPVEMRSNVGEDGYKEFVSSLKEDIRQGNIIQAVPSQRLARPLRGVSAFDVYRQLRVLNPSPYMFYLHLGAFEVVGASPEQLVKIKNRRVTNHPIAGTRKRGKTPEEDEALAQELLSDPKERAEHIMLVDLGRNDVGRVSTPGTVKVDSLMHIERYSHVMHIVSHVSGELAEGLSAYDAFRAVFPAGTVSGAPKIRAMQLVAKLEKERRGVYAGAVGYAGFSGVLDTCIAIRTLVVKDGCAYLQAGGGIVYDSEEGPEHEETVNKMKALAVAIKNAEEAALYASRRRDGGAAGSAAGGVVNLQQKLALQAEQIKALKAELAAQK